MGHDRHKERTVTRVGLSWMRRGVAAWGALLVMLGAVGPAAWLQAEDKGKEGQGAVLKTEDGLRFRLPADWPIEKRGGITAPIPIEEYLSRKLGAIESRLQSLEQQVTSTDMRLRVLEEDQKKQRLKSKEGAP